VVGIPKGSCLGAIHHLAALRETPLIKGTPPKRKGNPPEGEREPPLRFFWVAIPGVTNSFSVVGIPIGSCLGAIHHLAALRETPLSGKGTP
jgi:hypothetical protein